MSEELIDSYVDRAAVADDTKFLQDQLKTVLDLFDKVNATKVSLSGAKSTKDIAEGAKEAKAAIDNLAAGKENLLKLDLETIKAGKDIIAANGSIARSNKVVADSYDKVIKQLVENEVETNNLRHQRKILNERLAEGTINLEDYKKKLEAIRKEESSIAVSNQDLNRALRNFEKEAQAAAGSTSELRAQLNQALQAYDGLSAIDKKTEIGVKLKANIDSLHASITEAEQSTGRFQRNVGNYANSFAKALDPINGMLRGIQQQLSKGGLGAQEIKELQRQETFLLNIQKQLTQEFSSTKQQSRAFQEAVQQIGIEFGHQSEVFQAFKDHVGEGVDALNDIRDSIKLAASDTRQLDRLIGAATAVAGGFSIAQGAAALFGKENEEVQKALLKVQAVMAILNGLQAIQNELKNKDSLLRKLTGFLIKEETKAIQGQIVAQQANAAATNTAATATDNAAKATSRFGVALKAIGIGLLLTLIPLVSSAMDGLSKSTVKVDKDLEGMGDTALEIADNAIKALDDEIKSLNDSLGRTPGAIEKARKAALLLAKESTKVLTETMTRSVQGFFGEIQNLWENQEDRLTTIEKRGAELRAKIKELEFLQKLKAAEDFLQAEFEANKNAIKNSAELDKDLNDRKLTQLKRSFDERTILEAEFLNKTKVLLQANLNDELQIIQANLDIQLASAADNVSKRREAENNARKDRIIAERNYQDKLTELYAEAEKRRRKIVSTTIQGIVEITGSGLSKMAQALDQITIDNTPEAIKQWKRWQEEFTEAKDKIVAGLKDVKREFAETAVSALQDFASSIFESQNIKIREQIDALEEKKNKEIEVAQATILNEEERQDAITLIEKRAQSEREVLEKRQKALEIERAKFDKVFAVLQIAIDTAQKVAAIKAQVALLTAASTTNPFLVPLIPLAAAQIPFVIATGALAAATVAARPIPKLKKGRQNGPATMAITGDGGVPEVVASPDLKQHYVTPATDTLTYLPKDWRVFPDVDAFREAAMNMSFKPLPLLPAVADHGNEALLKAYAKQTDRIVQTIKEKPVTHITGNHAGVMGVLQYGSNWIEYVDKSVNF